MIQYDPPEGWRHGFPKPYKPEPGESITDTLKRDGYPPAMMDLARWTRFIGTKEELEALNDNRKS